MSEIIREKRFNILKSVCGKNLRKIAKDSNSAYIHVCNLLKEYERMGLIISEKKGRDRLIKLTEKGKILRNHLLAIEELLNE